MRTEIMNLYSQGIFGAPSTESVLRFWQSLERLHHPLGRFNVEYYTKLLEQEKQAMAQAQAQAGVVPPAGEGGAAQTNFQAGEKI